MITHTLYKPEQPLLKSSFSATLLQPTNSTIVTPDVPSLCALKASYILAHKEPPSEGECQAVDLEPNGLLLP